MSVVRTLTRLMAVCQLQALELLWLWCKGGFVQSFIHSFTEST